MPAVQWKNDNETWAAICDLHADSELVAFWNEDGTVSIETPDGRLAAKPGEWIIKDSGGRFYLKRRTIWCEPFVFAQRRRSAVRPTTSMAHLVLEDRHR